MLQDTVFLTSYILYYYCVFWIASSFRVCKKELIYLPLFYLKKIQSSHIYLNA